MKDLALTFGAKVGAFILAYAMQVVLARALNPVGRGTYDACLILASTLLVLGNPGTEMATMYFISSGRMSFSRAVGAGIILSVIIASLMIAIGVAIVFTSEPAFASLLAKGSRNEFALALITIPTTLLLQMCLSILTAQRDFEFFSALQIGRRLLGLFLLVIAVAIWQWGVAGALVSIVMSEALLICACLERFIRKHGLTWEMPIRHDLVQLLLYGIRYCVGKLSNYMNFKLGALALAFFATTEELGLYGQALAIAIQFMVISDSVFTIMLPRVAGNRDGRPELVARSARLTMVVGLAAMLLFTLAARPFFLISFSSEFLPSVVPFRVLVLGFFLRSLGKTLEPYLIGTDRPGAVSIAVLIGLAVNLVTLYFLYHRLGIVGAAWALTANYAVSTMVLVAQFRHFTGLPLAKICQPTRGDFTSVWNARPKRPR